VEAPRNAPWPLARGGHLCNAPDRRPEIHHPGAAAFDLERVMRTEYRIDDLQQNYFVIPSFDELLRVTVETDFAPLYADIMARPDIPVAAIVPDDLVLTYGSQAYAREKAANAAS